MKKEAIERQAKNSWPIDGQADVACPESCPSADQLCYSIPGPEAGLALPACMCPPGERLGGDVCRDPDEGVRDDSCKKEVVLGEQENGFLLAL